MPLWKKKLEKRARMERKGGLNLPTEDLEKLEEYADRTKNAPLMIQLQILREIRELRTLIEKVSTPNIDELKKSSPPHHWQ